MRLDPARHTKASHRQTSQTRLAQKVALATFGSPRLSIHAIRAAIRELNSGPFEGPIGEGLATKARRPTTPLPPWVERVDEEPGEDDSL
jgi:hypothetical protein